MEYGNAYRMLAVRMTEVAREAQLMARGFEVMEDSYEHLRKQNEALEARVAEACRDEPRQQLLEEHAAMKKRVAELEVANAKLTLELAGTREQLGAFVAVHG